MANIYNYWDSPQGLGRWEAPRPWTKRFRSEVYFLEKYFKPGMKVLDIGCATGDLYLGLVEHFGSVDYTGIDISEKMISRAKELAPEARFLVGNPVTEKMLVDQKFDLVVCTGVFQHEPQYQQLLATMLAFAKPDGLVLFDIKLFVEHPTICDIAQAYCDLPDPLYYIALNFKDALRFLLEQQKIAAVALYGYFSGTHESVRLPASVTEPVCSAHVLLQKGVLAEKQPMALDLQLPESFLKTYFK